MLGAYNDGLCVGGSPCAAAAAGAAPVPSWGSPGGAAELDWRGATIALARYRKLKPSARRFQAAQGGTHTDEPDDREWTGETDRLPCPRGSDDCAVPALVSCSRHVQNKIGRVLYE